jgi:hypothetical protein
VWLNKIDTLPATCHASMVLQTIGKGGSMEERGYIGSFSNGVSEKEARRRDQQLLQGVIAQREQARIDLMRQLLGHSKHGIIEAAKIHGVDVTKYITYYDLAEAIVSSQYPNLSDNPNS